MRIGVTITNQINTRPMITKNKNLIIKSLNKKVKRW